MSTTSRLRKTSVFVDDLAMKELSRIGKRLGLVPAQLIRLAVREFIERTKAAPSTS